MSKRINIYIREITHKLLEDFCEMNEYDKSRAVDELLYGRLKYLEEARIKAEKQAIKAEKQAIKAEQNKEEVKYENTSPIVEELSKKWSKKCN